MTEHQQKEYQLLFTADEHERAGEYEIALKNYREILKSNPQNIVAKNGEDRIRRKLSERIYYQTAANIHFREGKLELHWEELVFNTYNGTGDTYRLELIDEISVYLGRLNFKYGEEVIEISCRHAKKWKRYIQMAQNGRYPAER